MMESITLHGVFLDILGLGVLLTGESGIGKSELALGLINRKHQLIADDAILFSLDENKSRLIGTCPPVLQDFLEVRGLGILNIRALFGDTAIKAEKRLQLIVNVTKVNWEELYTIDRLKGMYRQHDILGIEILEVTVPVAAGRNLAVLIEAAARNELLKRSGYDAGEEFRMRQRQFMQDNSKNDH